MLALSNFALILDIDGVIRDVSDSYHRALADTVEHFTAGSFRPSHDDIDLLKSEGLWNNDWEASQELVKRFFAGTVSPKTEAIEYEAIVNFFQSRYRGENFTGYISHEPLIATPEYFESVTAAGIAWGFFSGATRSSATYVLSRLGIDSPVLVAMEDAPGKPDPTGLLAVSKQLGNKPQVIYVGDTVADIMTVQNAKQIDRDRTYFGVGVIPPHVKPASRDGYVKMMRSHGASLVLGSILELTPDLIKQINM
jgi:HAD superfamily phosphatase